MDYMNELFLKAQTATEDLMNANIRILNLEEQYSIERRYYKWMKTSLENMTHAFNCARL